MAKIMTFPSRLELAFCSPSLSCTTFIYRVTGKSERDDGEEKYIRKFGSLRLKSSEAKQIAPFNCLQMFVCVVACWLLCRVWSRVKYFSHRHHHHLFSSQHSARPLMRGGAKKKQQCEEREKKSCKICENMLLLLCCARVGSINVN